MKIDKVTPLIRSGFFSYELTTCNVSILGFAA